MWAFTFEWTVKLSTASKCADFGHSVCLLRLGLILPAATFSSERFPRTEAKERLDGWIIWFSLVLASPKKSVDWDCNRVKRTSFCNSNAEHIFPYQLCQNAVSV